MNVSDALTVWAWVVKASHNSSSSANAATLHIILIASILTSRCQCRVSKLKFQEATEAWGEPANSLHQKFSSIVRDVSNVTSVEWEKPVRIAWISGPKILSFVQIATRKGRRISFAPSASASGQMRSSQTRTQSSLRLISLLLITSLMSTWTPIWSTAASAESGCTILAIGYSRMRASRICSSHRKVSQATSITGAP